MNTKTISNRLKASLMVMSVSFLFFLCVQPVKAKDITAKFPAEQLSVRLKKIGTEGKVDILFDLKETETIRVPAFTAEKLTVEQTLDGTLSTTEFTYKKTAESSFAVTRKVSNVPVKKGAPGVVKGRVVENETSEPLPGATVKLAGTSYGAITNAEGYYTLPRVPSGKYVMEITYIGFSTSQQQIQIAAGRTNTFDAKMSADGEMLNEVTVSTVRRQRSSVPHMTEKMLTQEIKGLQVVASGISSEQISKSADRNAAQAVAKVSGVSIVDDKFVIVRGLNPRYNLTYLNDNVAPSTEPSSRSFALDLIPSRVIDRIVVQKSPSPDVQADATGGVVKIYTKDALAVKHFDLDVQIGHRVGTSFNKNFLTYNGGKTDWLGFDDGTRALPKGMPGYGSLLKAKLNPSEYAKVFNPTLAYGKTTALPNLQLTANYYDAWTVFGKTLSSLTSFSYKNDNQINNIYKQEGDIYRSEYATDKISYSENNINTVQLNLLQDFTLRLNENNRIFFKNFLLQQGTNTVVDRIQSPTYVIDQYDGKNKDIVLSYNQRFLYAGNLGGEHFLDKSKRHQFRWNAGYTFTRQETPDQRVIRFKGVADGYALGNPDLFWVARSFSPKSSDDLDVIPLSLGIISRLWSRNSEGVYNGSLDYTFKPVEWIVVKAGTFQQWKKRTLSRRVYTVHEGNLDPTRPFGSYVSYLNGNYVDANLAAFRLENLPNVWSESYLNDAYTGLNVFDRTSGSDMYVGNEQNNAGYLMFSLTPKKWIEVHGGIRYEYNRQKIGAAIPAGDGENYTGINKPILVDHATGLWLPSVNLSFKPTDKWVFRVAYGKTVNRTEFREVSPFKELDFENGVELSGSPSLVSADAANYESRLEFYPDLEKGDVISAGVFYKNILHPIERINNSDRLYSLFPSITYRNAIQAEIKGLEVELHKSLSFIPSSLFRNLSVAGNVSIIESKSKYNYSPVPTQTIILERPLQGQSSLLVNWGLYYDNAGCGSKIGVIYNYVGESIYAASLGGMVLDEDSQVRGSTGVPTGPRNRGSLIELPRHLLDFSWTQRVGKGLQLKLAVQNLLDTKMKMAEDFNGTNKYEPWIKTAETPFPKGVKGDNIASVYRPGRLFNLSISYSF